MKRTIIMSTTTSNRNAHYVKVTEPNRGTVIKRFRNCIDAMDYAAAEIINTLTSMSNDEVIIGEYFQGIDKKCEVERYRTWTKEAMRKVASAGMHLARSVKYDLDRA